VGPTIGNELKQKAVLAIILACVMIVIYISYSFRKVPKPASSFRFGISAIVALIHDVLVVVGLFAILGYFWHVEIDTLFVTALLTVIGFSVHDTIVVFDRIRENLPRYLSRKFEEVADISITQTLARSLNTSLTVVFVLLALLLFGGESIRWFVVALLVGIISGTYSSIFNATALLTWWEEKLGH
jgi:preprotein translocase subunit SecF